MFFLSTLFLAPILWAAPQTNIHVSINNTSSAKATLKVSAKCLKGPEKVTLLAGAIVASEWIPDSDAKCKPGPQALTLTLLEQDFHWEGIADENGIVRFQLSVAGSASEHVQVVRVESHESTGGSDLELKIRP